MNHYLDGFVFPIHKSKLDTYHKIAHQIAKIWKEHGAMSYQEFVGDELKLAGTLSFMDGLQSGPDECIIFGWLTFKSKEDRDKAHQLVAADSRIKAIEAPLFNTEPMIFDPKRMMFGGFKVFNNH